MASNRLARKVKREQLFAALEKFVNVTDDLGEVDRFYQQWPELFPTLIFRMKPEEHPDVQADYYRLTLFFRDELRAVWSRKDKGGKVLMLLGLRNWCAQVPGLTGAVEEGARLQFSADWRTGHFVYQPVRDFQSAVYALWKESWRAKLCRRCSRYFIAGKPAQNFCSPECAGAAKRERNRGWWTSHGKDWRKERQSREEQSSRESGKEGSK
jgi:hypothetical protein